MVLAGGKIYDTKKLHSVVGSKMPYTGETGPSG